MVSSLAAQLAKGASINATLLVDRSKRKWGESYLFTGREADQHDLETIHALAVNGFTQLRTLQPSLEEYEGALFSDAAMHTDRTLISREDDESLGKTIAAFLTQLGPYLMEAPTGKVIEWLVRRFRIHEFNVDDVLALFLPYFESPHMAKMLSILHIKEQTSWSFLLSFKSATKNPTRTALVTEMLKNSDVARFIVSLLPNALTGGAVHRALLVFNTSVILEFITRVDKFDASTMTYLLPALLEPLKETKASLRKDSVLGSYILLSALSHKCTFSPAALRVIVSAMMNIGHLVDSSQLLTALIAVLSAQEELDVVPDTAVDQFLGLRDVSKAIEASLTWSGVDKLINPLIPSWISRCQDDNSMLDSLLAHPDLPKSVIHRIGEILLQSLLQKEHSEGGEHRRLLSALSQRYPEIFQNCVKKYVGENDGSQDSVDTLLLTLSLPASQRGRKEDSVVASTNADPNVRIVAVKHILKALQKPEDLPVDEVTSLQDAIRARVADTDPEVVDAVYSVPQVVLPLISTAEFVKTLGRRLADHEAPRTLLRIHLKFICSTFVPANPGLSTEVVLEVMMGYMLFTKPRHKTASIVWESLLDSPLKDHELLGGTRAIVKESDHTGTSFTPDDMGSINQSITSQIAKNVVASNEYIVYRDRFIKQLADPDSHRRLLAHMVIRAILHLLSGEHRVDAGLLVLESMDVQTVGDMQKITAELDDNAVFEANLLKNVVSKPSARATTQRLKIAILILLPTTPCPPGVKVDWLSYNLPDSPDTRGYRFLELMRSIYRSANSSMSTQSLAIHISRSLFTNLGSDSLLFLAGVWTHPTTREATDDVAYAALRHASAFLQAQPSDAPQDFQVILPSLLCAAQMSDSRARSAAVDCISILSKLAGASKPTSLYAFDNVYGPASASLQYLDWADIGHYVNHLSEHREHLINDIESLPAIQHDFLSGQKADSKKTTKFKQRVLCFLLSHIVSCATMTTKLVLMTTIRHVRDFTKVQMLAPLVRVAVESQSGTGATAAESEFFTLVLSSFDATCSKDFNIPTSDMWSLYLSALQHFYMPGNGRKFLVVQPQLTIFFSGRASSQWDCLAMNLRGGLFQALNSDRQSELCAALLALATSVGDPRLRIKNLLSNLIQQPSVMVVLLTSFQPSPQDASQRAPKRAKLSAVNTIANDTETDNLATLTLLSEILSTQKLPPSMELISCLLETLHRVASLPAASHSELNYIEQLLMSSIASAAEEMKETPVLAPNAIRLDILVELLRVAENPQTFHQALLLMASLSRLAPVSVLHNIMPIFTFMGSNVFHRDDSYSFRVIQKTIQSIVPVMTSSLKQKFSDPLNLSIGSRDFLRIFTDASSHVPRHRRTHFFTHLVDVLGPADYLAPICMLLTDKVSNRVIRQSPEESQALLGLPLSLLQHYSVDIQVAAMKEILLESQRIFTLLSDPSNAGDVFLEVTLDDDQPITVKTLRTRQIYSLLVLVGQNIKSRQDLAKYQNLTLRETVSILVDVLTSKDKHDELNDENIQAAARWTLAKILGVMHTVDFSVAVLSMLQSGHQKIQEGALKLLAERLPNMTDSGREAISATIVQTLEIIKTIFVSNANGLLTDSAVDGLQSVTRSARAREEPLLADIVPTLLNLIRARPEFPQPIAALSSLVEKLGPRMIPHFRTVVDVCVGCLQSASVSAIFTEAANVITNLLKSIPAFWGIIELKFVIETLMETTDDTRTTVMESITKAIAKRVPSKTLIPTMCQLWPSYSEKTTNSLQMGRFFDLMKQALRPSPRSDVLGNLRPLFKLFLEGFDIRKGLPAGDVITVEDKVVAAYIELVVKLNESAFQPLFRRSYDWAFGEHTSDERKITFCRVYTALLDIFKGLMTPYMSLLNNPLVELFQSYVKKTTRSKEVWLHAVGMLSKSFGVDDGVFWRDDKIRQISGPLIEQLPVAVDMKIGAQGKTAISSCINGMVDCADDDNLLKFINLQVLMHTRSEDSRVRLLALSCSVSLWQAEGQKLIGFANETASFILECAEDENDDVVKESNKLKNAVEAEAGKIDGL
ncbi:hypothetical protein BD410DRAFT_763071 [Rickenella mellea]|uniref:U3 small nucleolar RNA-associated protein 10 n=1 Tax=Rickenella mellea TaxID=50990 RepID=A0A4Y7QGW0_9AGAM|nr:hypothetical protein BD410DRAFT_763071 [Rickenella mellea]